MLTDKQIKSLAPGPVAIYISDEDSRKGYGKLQVKVAPSGSKTFYFVYYFAKKKRFLAFGSYPEMSLADARKITGAFGLEVFSGKDPRDRIEKEYKAIETAKAEQRLKLLEGSIGQLFELFIKKTHRECSHQYYLATKRVLDGEMLQSLGRETKVNAVKPEDVARALRPIVARGSLVMANRARAYLSAAFAFGLQFDYSPERQEIDPLFNIQHNVVNAIPKALKSEKPSDRALDEDELKTFWDLIEASKLAPERKILLKLIVVFGGRRINEIIAAPWSEFDFKQGLWDRPSSRDKVKHHTLTPIGRMAIGLLNELHQYTGHQKLLFGDVPPTDYAINQTVRRLIKGRMDHFTPKCFRATAKTLMGKIGITKADRDMYHSHALTDVSSRHYDKYHYLPEKQAVVNRWESFLTDILAGREHAAGLRTVRLY